MGIKRITTDKQISDDINRQSKSIGAGIINILNIVGWQFVSDARDSLKIDTSAFPARRKPTEKDGKKKQPGTGDYMDDTGNLRGSIGYFILLNGVVIYTNMQGPGKGITAAQTMLTKVPVKSGYQLIGVAGMNYASYLESQGFNVITSQAFVAMVSFDAQIKAYAAKKGMSDAINAEVFLASTLR